MSPAALRPPAIKGPLAELGEVMQLSFMSRDFDAALRFWTEVVGAGPFFLTERVVAEELLYRGEPSPIDFRVAIGYWGSLQIELIDQRNDAPSIYREWRDTGREGLHHVCILVDDLDHARAACAAADAPVLQEGRLPGGFGRFLYAEPPGGPDVLLEIMEPSAAMRGAFAHMQDAARQWDGRDPVRSR